MPPSSYNASLVLWHGVRSFCYSNSTPSDPLPLSPLSSTGSMTGPSASCLPCCMPRVRTAPPRPPSQKPPAPPPATTTPAQPAIKPASVAPAPSPPRPRAPPPAPPPPPVAAMPFSPMPPPLSGAYDGDPWANAGPKAKLERESSLGDGEESPRAFMSTTMMK